MKLFISADIEGTSGICHWDETEKGRDLYQQFALQMSREVAAACEGAIEAGCEEILVKDAHDSARNIDPALLPETARIFRGWGADPLCMMAGLDAGFDGVVFTGYHSGVGSDANPLAHTMNTRAFALKINGEPASELYINCLIASYLGVPGIRGRRRPRPLRMDENQEPAHADHSGGRRLWRGQHIAAPGGGRENDPRNRPEGAENAARGLPVPDAGIGRNVGFVPRTSDGAQGRLLSGREKNRRADGCL